MTWLEMPVWLHRRRVLLVSSTFFFPVLLSNTWQIFECFQRPGWWCDTCWTMILGNLPALVRVLLDIFYAQLPLRQLHPVTWVGLPFSLFTFNHHTENDLHLLRPFLRTPPFFFFLRLSIFSEFIFYPFWCKYCKMHFDIIDIFWYFRSQLDSWSENLPISGDWLCVFVQRWGKKGSFTQKSYERGGNRNWSCYGLICYPTSS